MSTDGGITEVMVEAAVRACPALVGETAMRAALNAALTAQKGEGVRERMNADSLNIRQERVYQKQHFVSGKASPIPASWNETEIKAVADAIDAARYQHPENPRERPRPFSEADRGDREYAIRLARAACRALTRDDPAPEGHHGK